MNYILKSRKKRTSLIVPKSKQSQNTFLNVLKCILYFKKKSRQKIEISAQGREKDRYDNTKNKQHETVEDYVNIIP